MIGYSNMAKIDVKKYFSGEDIYAKSDRIYFLKWMGLIFGFMALLKFLDEIKIKQILFGND